MENQTPVLMGNMQYLDFMPYWNIPRSIVKKEILPKLMNDKNYLNRQDIELVSHFGNNVQAQAFSYDSIEELRKGNLRARQRPGKKNALGRVKFIFPNESDVYLHDTPANALFNKFRRDFSHGCVRVEDPVRLAEFVLKNQEGWNREAIQNAMTIPKTRRVVLKKSIPVLFFYTTSFFDENNNLTFYPDIYGHDIVLQKALAKPVEISNKGLLISKNAQSGNNVVKQ